MQHPAVEAFRGGPNLIRVVGHRGARGILPRRLEGSGGAGEGPDDESSDAHRRRFFYISLAGVERYSLTTMRVCHGRSLRCRAAQSQELVRQLNSEMEPPLHPSLGSRQLAEDSVAYPINACAEIFQTLS